MDNEHIPQSHVSNNYLPVEMDIEMRSDPPPPPSKTSTWRIKISKYWPFAAHLALITLVHQENHICVAGHEGVAKRGRRDGSGATLPSFDLRATPITMVVLATYFQLS
ncbi:hypothetical protein K443DRAFT_13526 [Laccaria amethystina LaAM-08-1]|uniref:Unplaced genomic scaffold K443scaffold_367, whole genome shotgun sequence n=1 Tax=Laccaria amethystina LaAM-08-1 TaxID=1095629 RepID=A0A0C9WI96_9AGAR|nr:hypothetical protein K443DRAFT_13526 [Laccaria amethystina LaAM-08-1]